MTKSNLSIFHVYMECKLLLFSLLTIIILSLLWDKNAVKEKKYGHGGNTFCRYYAE